MASSLGSNFKVPYQRTGFVPFAESLNGRLAMLGFVTPWMAGIGMSGSSLLVVLNSLRLQKPGKG